VAIRGRHASGWRHRVLPVLLCLLAGSAFAATRPVAELAAGEPIRLDEAEGLLVIAVDSSLSLQQVTIGAVAGPTTITLQRPATGRRVALYAVPAGRYRWHRVVERDDLDYDLKGDPEFEFDVRAAVVNYPGDLVFRPRGSGRAVLHIANRSLGILDRLATRHPSAAALPFEFRGHYADPFAGFYRQETTGREVRPRPLVRRAADPGPLPVSVAELWREPSVQRIALSPGGRWLARHEQSGDCATIELLDLRSGRSQVIAELDEPVHELGWAGDGRLVVGVGHAAEAQRVSIFRLEVEADGRVAVGRLQLPRRGQVIDLLPLVPQRLMFASQVDGQLAVYRLDIDSQAALDDFDYAWERRLNRGIDGDHLWLTDGNGRLRAVQSADSHGANVLYHGRGDAFSVVLREHDEHGFQPLRVSADGALIYGLSETERSHRELVALDPQSGTIATVFGRPGTDIEGPVFDLGRRLIGASFVEDGRITTEFFDPADRALGDELRAAFPDRSIRLLDRDRSGDQLILAIEGSDLPEAIYHYDRREARARLLQSSRPWLDDHRFAPAHVVHSRSIDGLQVESYLTLPESFDAHRPLVVMPHGGPIGIRNLRRFDPEVQFLASLGYAVLQVNFRGSAGFGREFREAGHGELGRMIESDIDAAIATALEQHPLDASRVCMLGSSYGGYSALASALRWPGRFRCAVSIAGISDRMLQYTASDSGRSAEVRGILETFMGDPDTESELMKATSPVYRYRELDLPVLLAHGTEDLRVDYEHTRRLVRMLNLADRAPTVVTLYGEGHSVEMPHNREKLWGAVAGFLREHLEPDRERLAGS